MRRRKKGVGSDKIAKRRMRERSRRIKMTNQSWNDRKRRKGEGRGKTT